MWAGVQDVNSAGQALNIVLYKLLSIHTNKPWTAVAWMEPLHNLRLWMLFEGGFLEAHLT